MEPLVHTLTCPNCFEAVLAFLGTEATKCEACGFDAEVFTDRRAALDRHRRFLADKDVIVADLVRLGNTRWVVAHTRMALL